ncbi:hypothetical protein ACJX0J_039578, partial [Zea mays]
MNVLHAQTKFGAKDLTISGLYLLSLSGKLILCHVISTYLVVFQSHHRPLVTTGRDEHNLNVEGDINHPIAKLWGFFLSLPIIVHLHFHLYNIDLFLLFPSPHLELENKLKTIIDLTIITGRAPYEGPFL